MRTRKTPISTFAFNKLLRYIFLSIDLNSILKLFRCNIAFAIAAIYGVFATQFAQAQDYPNKPIKLIVASAPGGGLDTVSRTLADYITNKLGKPVIVEFKPGAGSNIGSAFVAKSDPDGYTLLLGATSNAVNNSLYPNMQYNAATDLTPIVLVGRIPMVLLASHTVPIKNVKELLAYAQANPKSLNYGSGGQGTSEHLAFEFLKRKTGISAQHVIYRGGGAIYTDLIAGHIQLFFNNQLAATPFIQSGRLSALGITSPMRSPQLPDVRTFAEQDVPDFNMLGWWGVLAPAGIPKATISKINSIFSQAIRAPETQERLRSLGAIPDGGSAEEFGEFFGSQIKMWADIIKSSNIKIE